MGKLLDDFLMTMKEEHREELKKILAQDGDIQLGVVDRVLLKKQLDALTGTIKKEKAFSFKPLMQKGKMKSKEFNQNMEQIEADLRIIFFVSAKIDQYMENHFKLTSSEMQGLKKIISDMRRQLNRFKLLSGKRIPFSDYAYENFEFPEKTETDIDKLVVLGMGRSGEEYKQENAAEVRGGKLILSSIESTDQLKTGYGRALADVHVSRRNGYVEEMYGHDIRKAFDTSEDTYWAENLLVEEPITGEDNITWSGGLGVDHLQGAIVEIQISLHNVATVSELHFSPFTFYPLEVLEIVGYEEINYSGEMVNLVHPSHENPSQKNQKSVDTMIFRFPSVDIGSLRIVIRQETHSKSNYIVNTNDINSYELWMGMSGLEERFPDYTTEHETIEEYNRKLELAGINTYLNELNEWAVEQGQEEISQAAKEALLAVKSGDFKNGSLLQLKARDPRIKVPEKLTNQYQAVSKTSYIYGAKNIALYGRKYKQSSTYLSQRLDLSINVKKLMIETEEEHQYFTNKATNERVKVTDIEYYITGKKNPSIEEWQPILPVGVTMVEGERLLADNVGGHYEEFSKGDLQYSLRFRAISKGSITLYRNGIAAPQEHFIVSNDLYKLAIKREYYMPSAVYTVSYQPTEDAYSYDISKDRKYTPTQYVGEDGKNGESFYNVPVGSTLQIKHVPLISRLGLLGDEDKRYGYTQEEGFVNGGHIDYPIHIWADGVRLENITQYDSGTYDPENLSRNGGYTFAQVGKKITLGVPEGVADYKEVHIDYRHIVTDVRLKAILRRNTLESSSVTPALIEYSVKAETNDLEAKEGGVYIND